MLRPWPSALIASSLRPCPVTVVVVHASWPAQWNRPVPETPFEFPENVAEMSQVSDPVAIAMLPFSVQVNPSPLNEQLLYVHVLAVLLTQSLLTEHARRSGRSWRPPRYRGTEGSSAQPAATARPPSPGWADRSRAGRRGTRPARDPTSGHSRRTRCRARSHPAWRRWSGRWTACRSARRSGSSEVPARKADHCRSRRVRRQNRRGTEHASFERIPLPPLQA